MALNGLIRYPAPTRAIEHVRLAWGAGSGTFSLAGLRETLGPRTDGNLVLVCLFCTGWELIWCVAMLFGARLPGGSLVGAFWFAATSADLLLLPLAWFSCRRWGRFSGGADGRATIMSGYFAIRRL